MAAIYDALGNYMGDDGLPEGMLNQRPTPAPPVAPPAGVAPIAGNAPFQVYPPNVMGPMPPALAVADLNPSLEDPVDVTGAPGALDPAAAYADPEMDPGALNAADVPEGVLMEPPQDDGLFSFLNKPGASDSLVAFGSAMLRGNTFGEGLANAADAVTQVAQQYRMPTPREIAIAQMKGKLAQTAQGGGSLQKGDIWYAPDGRAYREMFDPASGSRFMDVQTGETVNMLPQGATQRVDSGVGERQRDEQKMLTGVRDSADKAFSNLQLYDDLESLIPTSGTGPDVVSRAKRGFVQATGIDIEGVDLSDMQVVNSLVRQLELQMAESQRGLGQLTEAERDIIRQSLVTLDSNPQAIRQIIGTLRGRAEKAQRLYEEWLDMPSDVKNADYNGSFETFAYRWKKANSGSSRQDTSSGGGPQVGAVDGGYRFKGGDPADPNSWEKVN